MAEAASQANTPVPGEELASIAARAQTYTGASGAAIALSEGDISSMTCRAASGPAAPDIGMQLRLEGTFTGMAVQSGQALRCDDSDTDKRVDAAACRALGTRAIVVVPIRDAETEVVIGVLAVFSGSKNAFNDLHVAVLRTMAREVAVAVQKARKAGISLSAPVDPPVSAVTASVPAPARPVSDPGFRPPIPTAAPPARPVTSPSMSAAAPKAAPQPEAVAPTVMSPAPVLKPATPPPPAPPKEELLPMAAPITPSRRTITAPPPAEWKPAPPPPGRKLEVVETPKTETPRAVSFGTFDSVAQDKKPGGGGMGIWIGVGAALVVILGGYFAYSHFASKPAATPTTQTAEAKPQPAAPAPTTAASETSSASSSAGPATTAANSAAAKPVPPPPQQKAATTPAPTPVQQQTPAPAPTQAPQPRQPQVVERAAVTPNASPRQDEAPKGLPAPVTQIAVPMTTSAASVASPPPKVSQSTAAQLISQVPPKYPDMARTMHATGTVVIEATIGTDGVVKGVKVLSGHPLLRDAAANSVRQWRYKPATLNGQPVETTVQVTVKFGG